MDSPEQPPQSSESGGTDTFTLGDAVLNRAKDVARRIAERVSRLTGDTRTDPSSRGSDPTQEAAPQT